MYRSHFRLGRGEVLLFVAVALAVACCSSGGGISGKDAGGNIGLGGTNGTAADLGGASGLGGGISDGGSGGETCLDGNCACPAGYTECNHVCVDLTTDISNCGACGLGCSISAPSTVMCAKGRCLATLATNMFGPARLALSDGHMCWTTSYAAGITRVPVGGGNPTILAGSESASGGGEGIAVDATNVFWVTHEAMPGVFKIPLNGGSLVRLAQGIEQGVLHPEALALDAKNLYFTDTTVKTAPINAASSGAKVFALASEASAVATDGTNVYWTDFGDSDSGKVMQMPAAGGAAITLASSQTAPYAIAVAAKNVYWLNFGDAASTGTVMTVPVGGGKLTTLASRQDRPSSIAVDGTSVYWANEGGSVVKVPIGGGPTTTLATGPLNPRSIVVDATSVYWIAADTFSSMKIVRLTPK